jgi:translation initiation factor IF-3
VKFTVRFKGRQLAHKELGFDLLDKIAEKLKGLIVIDSPTKNEGRTISMVVSPVKDFDKIYETKKEELID